jgi:hypothetical protein
VQDRWLHAAEKKLRCLLFPYTHLSKIDGCADCSILYLRRQAVNTGYALWLPWWSWWQCSQSHFPVFHYMCKCKPYVLKPNHKNSSIHQFRKVWSESWNNCSLLTSQTGLLEHKHKLPSEQKTLIVPIVCVKQNWTYSSTKQKYKNERQLLNHNHDDSIKEQN